MPYHLSPAMLDFSAARIDIVQISHVLGNKLLDNYIGLIVDQKLQTELYVLSFLLKDRVYPDDLWEIVGERSIEVKQDERLRSHQRSCTGGDDESHAIVERILIEERRKRCQMEVSLYSKAIERLEQYRTPSARMNPLPMHETKTPSAMLIRAAEPLAHALVPCAPLACSIATREKYEALTTGNDGLIPTAGFSIDEPSPLDGPTPSGAPGGEPGTANLNWISPTLPLMSTWVTTSVQEAFYEAFHTELTCQAELMAKSMRNTCDNAYVHILALDLLTLRAKMRRATAEMEIYTLAIENTQESDFSYENPSMSFYKTIPQPLSGEVDGDNNDVDDGVDVDIYEDTDGDMEEDYEFW
ncbi:hypothetical protein DEU56DRAFT_465360 [Suillus clintonianus]|uniref:uncharacterized protein n=1 Tax=Suillus clintonianus TaxID=1904413 RepID=UPI001B8701B5|nr:uncharacterized protein DEU56DRAFT_465360 [Suillus clintonianus]KAG2130716.1 hypothetical protein DEU56DRAFT_465360 [Suillus clintonianus]